MRTLSAISAVVALTAASLVQAAPFIVHDIGTLGAAGTQSRGFGVSITGVVAATSTVNVTPGSRYGMTGDLSVSPVNRVQYAPLSGGTESFLVGVGGSSGSSVVGFSLVGRGTHAVVGTGGTLTDIHSQILAGNASISNSSTSRVFGINAHDAVVGHVQTNSNNLQAFYMPSGGPATLIPSVVANSTTYTNSLATAVSDNGTVVGFGYNGSWSFQLTGSIANGATQSMAFMWNGGTPVSLGTLGGDDSVATAIGVINGHEIIVGQSTIHTGDNLANMGHAFVYDAGVISPLNELAGATSSMAEGINSSGIIVGTVLTSSGRKAFLYKDGVMSDLNDSTLYPGWTFLEANAINDDGYITGYANHNGQTVAFLLQPTGALTGGVPEPTAVGLLGVGAMVLAGKRRRA